MIQLMLKALGKSNSLSRKTVNDIAEERNTLKTPKIIKEEKKLMEMQEETAQIIKETDIK